MNLFKKYIFRIGLFNILIGLLFFSSCTDLTNLNTPKDQLTLNKLKIGQVGQAFAQAQWRGMFGVANETFQMYQSRHADQYVQYFSRTAPSEDTDQFKMIQRLIDGMWNEFYGNAAPQLKFVLDYTKKNNLPIRHAIAQVMKVEEYDRITDYWGPIIYSHFGNGKNSVPYDSQKDIYDDFFNELDAAVSVLKEHKGENAFGSNDQVYGGDVSKWLVFANSLRLRLAMRISYIEPDKAQKEAEKAVKAGVMTGNSDNADLLTTANTPNQYTIISQWNEYRMSASMESILVGYHDPRLPVYFMPAVNGDSHGNGTAYQGLRNGLSKTQKVKGINGETLNNRFSNMGAKWHLETIGPKISMMHSSEVYFLRAEGALRGWDMGGSAQEFYNDGIRQSLEWVTDATASEINNYINSMDTPIPVNDIWHSRAISNIPVKFDVSGNFQRKLEQIITQKWIALYPDSPEAWCDYRRTGYPQLYHILNSLNPNISSTGRVTRVIYPEDEEAHNTQAYKAAQQMLVNGPDLASTRLWWDANQNKPKTYIHN